MHHCITLPEIIRVICDEIHNEEYPNARDLLNLALVSHDWSTIALDCLWRRVSGLDCLIRCMPDDLWFLANLDFDDYLEFSGSKKRIILTRPLTDSDLNIFKKYAPRVQTFIHDDRIIVRPHIYHTLSEFCGHPLLPNLQTLQWAVTGSSTFDEPKRKCFSFIHRFLSPGLKTLHLDADISLLMQSYTIQTIPIKISPNISHLELTSSGSHDTPPSAVEEFSTTLCEWRHLSSLVIKEIALNGFFSLATLPNLKKLEIRSARYLWELPRSGAEKQSDLSKKLRSLDEPFPALKEITIEAFFNEGDPVPVFTDFFALFRKANFTKISLSMHLTDVVGGLQDLLQAIVNHCDHASLKKLKLDLGSVPCLPFSTIIPLFHFSALQSVHVSAFGVHHGMSISEADMLQMVSSWPDIRKLWILPNAEKPLGTTLLSLAPLTRSTKIRHLGLSLNASDKATRKELRENFPERYKGLRNYSLRTLKVGMSPVSHNEFVAKYLSEIFANLDDIVGPGKYLRGTVVFRRWHHISRVLFPLLSDVRRREREILGRKEVRPTTLKDTSRWFYEQAEKGGRDLPHPGGFGCHRYQLDWEEDSGDDF